ncbi:type VI secretion system ATPase TssH [Serratia marcescens]|uniref:Type VI secretion system ATPase TssH n=1 Tax=Serratia marcescens TaxID=615 RepID=A0A5C7CH23_SERMA|nr:type VI secretion system ATPase TssH [Serratia marcescens]TXE37232.1 type VI secretion system ATPase TssH [Serratia marcescens]TXE68295.1 type VI secretion system ATPase TssH [Serratia marcescens]
MIRIDLHILVERLHPVCRHMLEEAAALCVSQQGAEIRVEQLLLKALDTPLSDIRLILDHAGIARDDVRALLDAGGADKALAPGYPAFSPLLVELLQDGWMLASAQMNHPQLRSGVVLLAFLMTPGRYVSPAVSRLLSGINREQLAQDFDSWVKGSAEGEGHSSAENVHAHPPATGELLARFTHNLTQDARDGRLDPVLCRDDEIDLMIDILSRRRKNNPIIVGEAGVGKSALTEGLALRIVAGQVPDKLRDTELLSLDLGAMQAGAAVKGEFEKRFKGVMQEVKDSPRPVILFIDEAHTLIGAGNQAGGLDVSNLIKPALARGELRTIAATTWSEYKQYVEKDAALSRRFQLVNVGEPDVAQATVILRGLRSVYEKAHGVLIDEEALQAAASLSARYISGRQLPDKAIDVLDTACARVAINLTTPPREVSHLQTRLEQRGLEIVQLERQSRIGLGDHQARLSVLCAEEQTERAKLIKEEENWQAQLRLVQAIVALRAQLLATESEDDDEPVAALRALEQELDALQASSVRVSAHVDARQVASVVAEWTGVPVNCISQSELDVVMNLPAYLGDVIRGQSLAIEHLHKHLLTARADLRRTGRPLGAFLLVGPSGVGKTETVVQIAELLFGGRHYLTTINMSEYQEKHTVSRLIGSPPGYVGFGEGGVLTEAIRRKPYSVVLLDEVEKAHPDVLNLFYQAFDKGEMADGEGRVIDCKNVVFFLTSNLGYQTIVDNAGDPQALHDALYPELTAFFRPALLARMEIIPYLPLSSDTLRALVQGKLAHLSTLLAQRFGASVETDDAVVDEILRRATRSENGARMLESIIDGALLPPLSLKLLQKMSQAEPVSRIRIGLEAGDFVAVVEG